MYRFLAASATRAPCRLTRSESNAALLLRATRSGPCSGAVARLILRKMRARVRGYDVILPKAEAVGLAHSASGKSACAEKSKMADAKDVLDAVRHALKSEARVRPTQGPIRLSLADGALTMEGEVADIAGKKLALKAAAKVPGVSLIIDRLHVRPATPMGDGEIRDKVRDALLEETALADCTIRVFVKGELETVRAPANATGTIDIKVEDGIVTLDGDVAGWGQKRLAGVLAWWVPGSRDVINGLGVTPPEEDSDDAVTDAVLQVLEKDPFVNAESIRVQTRNAVVVLSGVVPRAAERDLAENDAWYVFGVDNVINRLDVRP